MPTPCGHILHNGILVGVGVAGKLSINRLPVISVLIFRLNGASEEVAEEVRELLEQHDLAFYETSAGRWGISVAGLWLSDESQKLRARELIEQYQGEREQRFERSRAEQPGFLMGLWLSFSTRPIAFVLTTLLLLINTKGQTAPNLPYLLLYLQQT